MLLWAKPSLWPANVNSRFDDHICGSLGLLRADLYREIWALYSSCWLIPVVRPECHCIHNLPSRASKLCSLAKRDKHIWPYVLKAPPHIFFFDCSIGSCGAFPVPRMPEQSSRLRCDAKPHRWSKIRSPRSRSLQSYRYLGRRSRIFLAAQCCPIRRC